MNTARPNTRTSLYTLLGLGSASLANAAIIHKTDSFSVGLGSTETALWNIDGAGLAEAEFSAVNSGATLVLGSETAGFDGVTTNPGIWNLPTTYLVQSSRSFNFIMRPLYESAFDSAFGFNSGESGYFGFKFKTDTPLYGWARATFTEGANGGVTIHEWAYEDSGAPIQVGAIPEPETAVLGLAGLALGAAGLRRWRRKSNAESLKP